MVQLEAEGKWVEREWGQHAAKAHMVELNLDHCSKDKPLNGSFCTHTHLNDLLNINRNCVCIKTICAQVYTVLPPQKKKKKKNPHTCTHKQL